MLEPVVMSQSDGVFHPAVRKLSSGKGLGVGTVALPRGNADLLIISFTQRGSIVSQGQQCVERPPPVGREGRASCSGNLPAGCFIDSASSTPTRILGGEALNLSALLCR